MTKPEVINIIHSLNRIPFIEDRLIISLYDYTGQWAQPYIDAGYPVILWDKKVEGCILEGLTTLFIQIEEAIECGFIPYGLLSATPCDDFAVSGARWFAEKDKPKPGFEPFENSVEFFTALAMVHFIILERFPSIKFWSLENPVGRIETLVPELKPFRKLLFNPCDFGDPYTKKTVLWGNFNHNLKKTPVQPEFVEYRKKDGSITKLAPQFGKTGGKSEKTKSIRSATPKGFAKAFFEANR